MPYHAICRGGPHHGKNLQETRPIIDLPVLNHDTNQVYDGAVDNDTKVKMVIGQYMFVPAHWKWLPPENGEDK